MYGEFSGLDPETLFAFTAIIRRMDNAYLKHQSDETKGGGGSGAEVREMPGKQGPVARASKRAVRAA